MALAAGAVSCRDSAASERHAEKAAAPEVQVAPVTEARLNRTITVSGTLAAEEQAILSMRVPGRLSLLVVDLGSPVRTGQPIAQLEQTDFVLRVNQAEAGLRQARARLGLPDEGTDDAVVAEETAIVRQMRAVLHEAELTAGRMRAFLKSGISSRADVDAAEAALRVAESRHQDALEEVRNRQAILSQRRAELALAREQLSATVLRAPFDGRILDRPTAVGQFLSAGTPVATVVRIDPLRLRVEIPEREARHVGLGQPVHLTLDGNPATYSGRVTRFSPAISPESRTLLVEASIRNDPPSLRPGAFVRAEIITGLDAPALLVPAAAIVTFAGVDKVYTVRDGRAVEHRVELGRRDGDRVEVLKGLTAGEAVVLNPRLVSNQAVRIAGR